MFVLWLSLSCIKRALEEKKLARDVARNSERLAMHNFHEKTALVEVFSKVFDHRMANSAKSIEKDHRALKAKVGDEDVPEKSLEAK
ncbi:hypothetical protein MtrunA17_Chr4g0025001 [Medicago truncatula]|uniref:Uncharacterized protein n=1 Tax=Medicago truncatula TaxID=3880 RepID=A0A396I6J5_MEDTR|nr:hypothetical protein MtrunA17_Chr4g0025001 [Medicago truncatula]